MIYSPIHRADAENFRGNGLGIRVASLMNAIRDNPVAESQILQLRSRLEDMSVSTVELSQLASQMSHDSDRVLSLRSLHIGLGSFLCLERIR